MNNGFRCKDIIQLDWLLQTLSSRRWNHVAYLWRRGAKSSDRAKNSDLSAVSGELLEGKSTGRNTLYDWSALTMCCSYNLSLKLLSLHFQTYDGDPLPRKICHTCLFKVTQTYEFRNMALQSYEKLKSHLLPLKHTTTVKQYLEKSDELQRSVSMFNFYESLYFTHLPWCQLSLSLSTLSSFPFRLIQRMQFFTRSPCLVHLLWGKIKFRGINRLSIFSKDKNMLMLLLIHSYFCFRESNSAPPSTLKIKTERRSEEFSYSQQCQTSSSSQLDSASLESPLLNTSFNSTLKSGQSNSVLKSTSNNLVRAVHDTLKQ